MTGFDVGAILLTGAAAAGYLNHRFFKLPTTIGLMLFALLLSGVEIGLDRLGLVNFDAIHTLMSEIDFSSLVMKGFLSFLLFASALHIDLDELRRVRVAVACLSSIGVVLSTVITGGLIWWVAQLAGLSLTLNEALLFGALISPTDPIAVLAILKDVGVSKRFYARIGGESLFNDGMGVMLFVTFLGAGHAGISSGLHFLMAGALVKMFGGALLGYGLGWAVQKLMQGVNDYKVEVLLTLALASGGYSLALMLDVSAPIAMAAAGLVIGYHRRLGGPLGTIRRHLDLFWELLDEVLNAVLFLLMGLELTVVSFHGENVAMGLAAIAVILVARLVSVGLPISLIRLMHPIAAGTIRLLTWGGLRGGLSIAMALSLPPSEAHDMILTMTYIVVIFSILVQGLTFRKLAAHILPPRAS